MYCNNSLNVAFIFIVLLFCSDEDSLVLASGNVFGYRVTVSNTAEDDGLNPTLMVQLSQGVLLEEAVSGRCYI